MKTSCAITAVALAYLIALASGEEAPANDAATETKAENYRYGGRGDRFYGGRGYGDRDRYRGGFRNGGFRNGHW